jgi:TM2 domain-containing membrane protein YozV
MENRYWLSIGDGKPYGPYTMEELLRFRQEGRVQAGAQLCVEGTQEWIPAERLLEPDAPSVTPPVTPPPPPPPGYTNAGVGTRAAKSKVAAGVLGILLGALGIHNFYLGYIGKGVAQLLITVLTCGYCAVISWIWGLIEGILILTGSINVDGDGVPLKD